MPLKTPDAEPPVVIVGAGAAGLMAAIFAAGVGGAAGGGERGSAGGGQRPGGGGRRVVLLERTRDGGRKILVSGGGRCNVLPAVAAPERFVTSSSPHTLRKILLSWPLAEQREFFEQEVGVALALEAESGKLFPRSNQAREVRDRLLDLTLRRGVELRRDVTVVDLLPPDERGAPGGGENVPGSGSGPRGSGRPGGENGQAGREGQDRQPLAGARADVPAWRVVLGNGETLAASAVVLATGGLSLPGTGSDGTGLAILRRLGVTIHQTYPALTPLTVEPPRFAHLAGISLPVTVRAPVAGAREQVARGGFLFTHRGYSGPVVLDVSHLAVLSRLAAAGGRPEGPRHLGGAGETEEPKGVAPQPRQQLLVQWTEIDAAQWEAELRQPGASVLAPLRRRLPDRLAEALLDAAEVPAERSLSQLRRDERQRLIAALTRFPLPWTGDEGYRKAEVTGGGVALGEVAARTLECVRYPGLFLCGELLDAFGPIGGHNFQWAWTTGRTAGLAAGRSTLAAAVRE